MKNRISSFTLFLPAIAVIFALFGRVQVISAQTGPKPSVAIPDFDTRGYTMPREEAIQFVINELIRVGQFEVMDRYDIEYIAKRDTLQASGCFSKMCLVEFGQKLQVDKMFSGSIQQLGDKLNVTLRLLDVPSGTFEKMVTKEFLNIKGNELMMIRVTINDMFGITNDPDMVKKLTVQSEFDNTVNNPYQIRLRADGPRMGVGFFTGTTAAMLMAPESEGGFAGYPFMFNFGYQFEKQYLNEGNFQALFEFIPNVGGMDQGRFIPSFTFLNGLRNNTNGWEFAFGPIFSFTKMSKGFVDSADKWHLASDYNPVDFPGAEPEYERRLDSRGVPTMNTGFLFGFGKTLKSGKMNIPVNAYIIPGKSGIRFGVSFGWNGKDRYELRQ